MPPQTSGRHDPAPSEMTRLTKPPPPEKKQPPSDLSDLTVHPPADGGVRAWLVVLVSFLCNGVIFGIVNCYGVLYVSFLEDMETAGVANAAFKCSLAGSLCTGLTFLMSAASGVLADHVGMRRTACCGAILGFTGLLISAFVSGQFEALLVTYGLLFGTGASLVYTPSLVVLGHYFQRKLGLVNGLCAMGSSVFTFIMPFVMTSLLGSVGIRGTLLVLAGLVGMLAPLVLLFRAQHAHSGPAGAGEHPSCSPAWICSQLINVHIWRNRRYLVWSIAVPMGLFGYFVPYVHLVKYVRMAFPASNGTWLVPCLGATSGLGRLVFGRIADMPRFNKIALQQVSFLVIGTLTITLAFCRSFPLLVAIVLAMGLFDGCFISLLGPIAFELVGPAGASQAIGFLLTLCSVPLTVGPPVAGILYDQTHSYRTAFVLAGCPPIVAALVMCLIHRLAPTVPDAAQQRKLSAAMAEGHDHEQLPQCEQLLGAASHAV